MTGVQTCALPISSQVAATDGGVIASYHQGLGFTAEGRLCVALEGTVSHYGAGTAPMDAASRLVVTEAAATDYIGGVGYNDGKVSIVTSI